MAEPTTVDNGSLTDYEVAVDDLGADGVAGLAKLLVSADGSSARIPADAANGLDVDVTRVQGTVTVGGTVALSGTSPVSAASLPLPSGASTAAKQPALGVAGTPSSDVVSVQGVASGTVIPVSDGGGSLTVDGTVAVSGTVPVSDAGGTLSVDDGAGSLTVDGTVTANAGTGPWPVTDNGGSLTVDGTVAATQSGTWNVGTVTTVTNVVHVDDNSGTLSVDDGGGSITVDAVSLPLPSGAATLAKQPALGTAGSASADVITVQGIASGTVIPVSDGGGSLTVDGTVAVSGTVAVTDNSGSLTVDGSVTADTELTTKDYDTGAGTDTQAVVGLLLPASGGAVAGGTATAPVRTDPTGTTAQPVTDNGGSLTVDGTVAATQSGTWNVGTLSTVTNVVHVDDNSGSLTVDNAGTFAVQATLAAGATSIGKAEDVASADADVGVPAMGVRKATPANTSGTDGDYEMLQLSAGRLWVSATVDAALPAGTNAIGKLAANSGVDIGALSANQTVNVAQINGVATTMGNGASGTGVQRVTVASDSTGNIATIGTSVVPGTSATHLGKAEDAVHVTGDTGVAVWGVALADANALTLQASATGDYSILSQDARGILQVVARPNAARIQTTSAGLTTASTAYSIGDQVGTILTITNAAKVSGGSGIIQSIHLLDEGDVATSFRLHFYVASVTLASDNAAFAVSDADQRSKVGTILMPDMVDMGANRETTLTNVGLGYLCSGSTSLFCAIETRTANSFFAAVGDLKLTIHVYQD